MPLPSPVDFFGALWSRAEGGHLQLGILRRPGNPGQKIDRRDLWFTWPKGLDAMLERAAAESTAGSDAYYGVGIRNRAEDIPGCVFGVPALWVTFNLPIVPRESIKRTLGDFPLKPSAGWLAGETLTVYWFLDELAAGKTELDAVWPVNGKLRSVIAARIGRLGKQRLEAFHDPLLRDARIQDRHYNPRGLLRVPGTLDHGVKPPKEVEVVSWRPEVRHRFTDLIRFVIEHDHRAVPASGTTAPEEAPKATPVTKTKTVDVPGLPLPEAVKKIIREGLPAFVDHRRANDPPQKFEERQKKGKLGRSEADAYVVTHLICASVSDTDIYDIYRDAENRVGELYRSRRDKDQDKYLGLLIQQAKKERKDHPKTSADGLAENVANWWEKEHGDAPMQVIQILKLDYEDPVWEVTTRLAETGEECVTRCPHQTFGEFKRFKLAYLAQHNEFPPDVKQKIWQQMVNGIRVSVKHVEREVATKEGEIKEALEEWLSEAHSEPNEATIQYLPVAVPEEERVYLRLPAFMQYLTSQKIETKRHDVTKVLTAAEFKRTTQKFGRKPVKVWAGPLNGVSGNGHKEPTKAPEPPKPKPVKKDLFDEPGSNG